MPGPPLDFPPLPSLQGGDALHFDGCSTFPRRGGQKKYKDTQEGGGAPVWGVPGGAAGVGGLGGLPLPLWVHTRSPRITPPLSFAPRLSRPPPHPPGPGVVPAMARLNLCSVSAAAADGAITHLQCQNGTRRWRAMSDETGAQRCLLPTGELWDYFRRTSLSRWPGLRRAQARSGGLVRVAPGRCHVAQAPHRIGNR